LKGEKKGVIEGSRGGSGKKLVVEEGVEKTRIVETSCRWVWRGIKKREKEGDIHRGERDQNLRGNWENLK